MLVLSRRPGESIVIGNDIVVTVLEVRGGQIRIGIDAPRNLQVHREEVYQEVCRENEKAVASMGSDSNLLRTTAAAIADRAQSSPRKPPTDDDPGLPGDPSRP